MTPYEAIIIAKRMRDDEVVGPVGMALRVLLEEYEQMDRDFSEYVDSHGGEYYNHSLNGVKNV